MKLSLDKKHGNRIEFIAKDLTLTLANIIRRYSMTRVPILAIDSVVFYDNNSAFWDEYLSHRLGLIPITTPENLPESTEVVFTLDAEGPKAVHASDMASNDKGISVAAGAIVIATLGPNQKLRFEGKAILGTSRKHAKYQAGLVSYGQEKDNLKMMVESFYQMEPSEVLLRGCAVIESDIEKIEEALGKKPEKKKKASKKKKDDAGEEKSSKKKEKEADEKEEKEE
jgi:DNA-directed RNA polymerase subunit D